MVRLVIRAEYGEVLPEVARRYWACAGVCSSNAGLVDCNSTRLMDVIQVCCVYVVLCRHRSCKKLMHSPSSPTESLKGSISETSSDLEEASCPVSWHVEDDDGGDFIVTMR